MFAVRPVIVEVNAAETPSFTVDHVEPALIEDSMM
jgi:hypothetical protein